MKIKNQKILDLDGNAIPHASGKEKKDLTLKDVLVSALMNPQEEGTGDKKLKRFKLAQKIHDNEEYEITSEEAVELKQLVAKQYNPLVVGRVYEAIEK